jgi:hypothetical protein
MDTFNPQNLALPKSNKSSAMSFERKKPPRHRVGEKFLKGPIPYAWLSRASELQGKTLHVGLAIWFLAGVTNSRTVKLPQLILGDFSVNRHCKYRALKWLEEANLIAVKTEAGCATVIMLLDVSEREIVM